MQESTLANNHGDANEDPHETRDETILLQKADNGTVEVPSTSESRYRGGCNERDP